MNNTLGLFLAALLFAAPALARDITFAWDYPPTDGIEFELYVVPADQLDWGEPAWRGAETQALVADLDETTRYRAAVRAVKGDLLSPISNIIVFTPGSEPQTIELPDQVRELRITW
jgi:hypothetical protein